jgi:hypothetical protein
MNNEILAIKRRKTFAILAFVALAFIAVAVWVFVAFDQTPPDEAKINNLEGADISIHPTVKSIIQKRLREAIDLAYGVERGKDPIGTIRNESVVTKDEADGTKQYSFLVDVDNYEVTYRAEVWEKKEKKTSEVFFYCVPPRQSKYPDKFCVGYNGQSTISVTIGYSLPLIAKQTNIGNYYDARIKYKENSIWPYIEIFVSSCGNERIKSDVREDFSNWIKDQGYNPSIYNVEIPDNCTGGE